MVAQKRSAPFYAIARMMQPPAHLAEIFALAKRSNREGGRRSSGCLLCFFIRRGDRQVARFASQMTAFRISVFAFRFW
jgi:hypothetical protein